MLWRAKSTTTSTNRRFGRSGSPEGGDAGGTLVRGGWGGGWGVGVSGGKVELYVENSR